MLCPVYFPGSLQFADSTMCYLLWHSLLIVVCGGTLGKKALSFKKQKSKSQMEQSSKK
jgi:hypothetical protein